jgi:hypothetical protein
MDGADVSVPLVDQFVNGQLKVGGIKAVDDVRGNSVDHLVDTDFLGWLVKEVVVCSVTKEGSYPDGIHHPVVLKGYKT